MDYVCVFTVVDNAFLALECTEHTYYDLIIASNNLLHLKAMDMVRVLAAVGANIPIVLMLEKDERIEMQGSHDDYSNIFDFIRKPFKVEDICNLIVKVMEKDSSQFCVPQAKRSRSNENIQEIKAKQPEKVLSKQISSESFHLTSGIQRPLPKIISGDSLMNSDLKAQDKSSFVGKESSFQPLSPNINTDKRIRTPPSIGLHARTHQDSISSFEDTSSPIKRDDQFETFDQNSDRFKLPPAATLPWGEIKNMQTSEALKDDMNAHQVIVSLSLGRNQILHSPENVKVDDNEWQKVLEFLSNDNLRFPSGTPFSPSPSLFNWINDEKNITPGSSIKKTIHYEEEFRHSL